MKSPHLHAVLFDLDGTLRHSRPGGFETLLAYLAELGHAPGVAQQRQAERWTHYYWSASPELLLDLDLAGDDEAGFDLHSTRRYLEALSVPGDREDLLAQVRRMFSERYEPVEHVPEDALPTLARLRAAGYRLGLVSNRKELLEPVAEQLGLAGAFDFTLSAGQARSWKPDPGIFRQAAALAGCAPEAAVYVGDNFYADVEGARGAGLRPVLIDPRRLFDAPGCPVVSSIAEVEIVLPTIGTNRLVPPA